MRLLHQWRGVHADFCGCEAYLGAMGEVQSMDVLGALAGSDVVFEDEGGPGAVPGAGGGVRGVCSGRI